MHAHTPAVRSEDDDNITSAFFAKGSSSFDPRFPPQNALEDPADTSRDRFWTTSGLYPHFVQISLHDKFSSSNISFVSIELLRVCTLKIVCVDNSKKPVCELSKKIAKQDALDQFVYYKFHLEDCDGIRTITFCVSGWTDFCSIRKVQIIGSTTSRVLTLNVDTTFQSKGLRHTGASPQPITTSPDLPVTRPWSAGQSSAFTQSKTSSVSVNLFGSPTGVNSNYSFLVASRKHRGRRSRREIDDP